METLTHNEKLLLRLAGWREARGDGLKAVTAVIMVLFHRAGHIGFAETIAECVLGENQISSMSIVSDPEFFLKPEDNDPIWQATEAIVDSLGAIPDPSNGALFYANLKNIQPGGWFQRVILDFPQTHPILAVIQKQTFFA